MISFIIIGRNEGWKLEKCFESVFQNIIFNKINDYEVLYIDSNSNDNSIANAKSFKEIKIYKLISGYNAAVARNLGAEKARGENLFFLDGDMEIIADFLPLIYNEREGLLYNFVSGQFIDYNYDLNGNYINKKEYHRMNGKDQFEVTTGGLFCIKKDVWLSVGGMKTKYKRCQDLDFGLRLAKKGVKLLRKKEIMAKHHTMHHLEKYTVFKILPNHHLCYSKSLLYRDHMLIKSIIRIILRNDYTMVLLIICGLLSFSIINYLPFYFYILTIIIRSIINANRKINVILKLVVHYIYRDIMSILGFILFFPSKINDSDIKYIKIS
jgi:glycosyltransferase involved in cell wall biosynthesis